MPLFGFAQSNNQAGLLPAININKKLPKDWSINFKTESRQLLFKEVLIYDYLLTDFSIAGAKKIGVNTTVAAGYLLRVTDDGFVNRAIQQISFVKRYQNFKIAHRVSADQTFEKHSNPEFRFRYRATAEIPLNGQALDPKELFLKFNNEYLNAIKASKYDLEIRAVGLIGYAFTTKSKLEFGLDYRLDSFIDCLSSSRSWISLNFYQSI